MDKGGWARVLVGRASAWLAALPIRLHLTNTVGVIGTFPADAELPCPECKYADSLSVHPASTKRGPFCGERKHPPPIPVPADRRIRLPLHDWNCGSLTCDVVALFHAMAGLEGLVAARRQDYSRGYCRGARWAVQGVGDGGVCDNAGGTECD